MKTKLITLTAILLILTGGLASCNKELSESQLGLYVEIYPLVFDENRKLKIEFVDKERLFIIGQVSDPKSPWYPESRSEFRYKIQGRKIELTPMWHTEQGMSSTYFFRWINNHKFEIGWLHPRIGSPAPPNMTFEKRPTDNN